MEPIERGLDPQSLVCFVHRHHGWGTGAIVWDQIQPLIAVPQTSSPRPPFIAVHCTPPLFADAEPRRWLLLQSVAGMACAHRTIDVLADVFLGECQPRHLRM